MYAACPDFDKRLEDTVSAYFVPNVVCIICVSICKQEIFRSNSNKLQQTFFQFHAAQLYTMHPSVNQRTTYTGNLHNLCQYAHMHKHTTSL